MFPVDPGYNWVMEMSTRDAARYAKVSITTIRTWCRIGAVAARKAGGRWLVDTASLLRRCTIGAALTIARHLRRKQQAARAIPAIPARSRRYRGVRCECASGRYGGVCTCC